MLKHWPVEKLFWWSCLPERHQRFGQKVLAHHLAKIPDRLYPNVSAARQKCWVLQHLWSRWAARHLARTIHEVRPAVIWVIPHVWSIPPLVQTLPDATVGFHTSVHDYPDIQANVIRLGTPCTQRLATDADHLFATATTRDAISQPMAEDLRKRTGKQVTQILRAGLDPADFAFLLQKQPAKPAEIRIGYAGTIVVEQEFALFAAAFSRIRNQLPTPVKLDLFGAHSYRSRPWFDTTCMREHGNLPEPELKNALRECSWGFSPMSLADGDSKYNRFSFPTKFSSYLAAGLPIITLGHPDSSVLRTAQSYGVGPCLTSSDPQVIERELLSALKIENPWLAFKDQLLRCAQSEFDSERMRTTLYQCFDTCARTHPLQS
jgi:hypothetical protein